MGLHSATRKPLAEVFQETRHRSQKPTKERPQRQPPGSWAPSQKQQQLSHTRLVAAVQAKTAVSLGVPSEGICYVKPQIKGTIDMFRTQAQSSQPWLNIRINRNHSQEPNIRDPPLSHRTKPRCYTCQQSCLEGVGPGEHPSHADTV